VSEVTDNSSSARTKANYTYSSDGAKLKVRGAQGEGYDYIGSMTLVRGNNGLLTGIEGKFAHGMFRSNGDTEIMFFEKDHLGSVRSVINEEGVVLATNDFYPFGLRHDGGLRNDDVRYSFNGKELQTTGNLGLLDYGARMYDSETGRLFVLDPLADKFSSVTPYVYCLNDPISIVDPDGKMPVWVIPVVKGLAFGVADMAAQISAHMAVNGSSFKDAFNDIDWASVGMSAAAGVVPGGRVAKSVFMGGLVLDSAIDISINDGVESIFDGTKPVSHAMIDAAAGAMGASGASRLTKGARASIAGDINSGWFKTLTKSDQTMLLSIQKVLESQGMKYSTDFVFKMGLGGVSIVFKDTTGDGQHKGLMIPFEGMGIRQDATRVDRIDDIVRDKKTEDVINEWLSQNPNITVTIR